MAKIQIKNSFITSSAQITISSSLVRFSDNIRAKGITGSFSGSFAGSNMFVQGGNSFGTTALIGTNDNQSLALETNGSEKLRVTSAGNVGIGTSNPIAKLHTVGSNGSTDYVYQQWSYISNVGVYDLILKQTVTSNVVRYNFSMNNASTAYNDVLVLDRGCLGIGTSFPLSKLDVRGTMYVNYGSNGTGYIQTNGTDSDLQITTATNLTTLLNTGTSGAMAFGAGNSERMRILSGGNVGIGTTTPTQKLEVAGYAMAGESSYRTSIYGNASGAWIAFGDTSNTVSLGRIGAYNALFNINSINGDTSFQYNSSEKMRITTGGNVGIGTSSPNANLHVSGTFQVGNGTNFGNKFTVYDNLASGKISFALRDTNGDDIFSLYANSTTGEARLIADDDQGVAFMTFQMNASERMRITNGGNVGIGSNNPAYTLDVVGPTVSVTNQPGIISRFTRTVDGRALLRVVNSDANSTAAATHAGVSFVAYSNVSNRPLANTHEAQIMLAGTGTGTSDLKFIAPQGMTFWVSGSNVNMTGSGYINYGSQAIAITPGRRVGIGSSSPGNNLDVYNGSGWAGTDLNGTSGGELRFLQSGTLKANIYASTSTALVINSGDATIFQIGASEKMRLTGGNLGIGTSSPSAFLDIVGNGIQTILRNTSGTSYTSLRLYNDQNSAVRALEIDYSGASYSGALITSGPTGESACITTTGAYPLAFGTNNTARMTILSGGNVGIATSSPTAKLQVGTQMYGSAPDANYFVVGNENFSGPGPVGGISGYPTTANRNQVTASMFDVAGGWERVNGSHALLRVSAYDVINSTPALTVLNNGNVGMGTTAPISLLDVRSGYITAGSSASTNGSTILAGYYSNSAGILTVLGTEFSSGGPVLGYAVTPSTSGTGAFLSSTTITIPRSAYTQDGGTHRWYTGAAQSVAIGSAVTTSEKMRINSDGNLGIGTTTPAYKLDINGITRFQNIIRLKNDGWNLTDEGQVRFYFDTSGRTYFGSGNGYEWRSVADAALMVLTNAGNVGIGTTSPVAKLDINGTSNFAPNVYHSIGGQKFFAGSGGAFSYIYTGTTALNFINGSDTSTLMSLLNNGNLGIGTTTPAYKFHIYSGSMYVQGGAGASVAKNYTSFSRLIFDTDHSDSARGPNKITLYDSGGWVGGFGVSSDIVGYYSGGHHVWLKSTSQTAFTEYMRLNSNGNLGIGTSTSVPSPLTVYNNADVWHFRLGSSTGELRFGGATNNGAVIQSYTPAGVVRDLYIQRDGGNVGIGTNAPVALLDVRGNTKFGSSLSNTHQFTGSVNFGGSTYNNSIAIDKFEYFSLQPYIEGGSFPSNVFSLSGTFPTFVTMTGSVCPFGKVAYNVSYYEAIGDYIPVQAGETLYGEIWAYRSAGATGTAGVLYCGIARYDKDKKPIDGNAGLTYFIVQNATVPSNSTWTKYSNTTTLPLTHTPYAGSDGGPVRYVRPYIIVNYTAGTVPTYWAAFKIRKQQLTRDLGAIVVSGSMGIGTSSPSSKLHIYENANRVSYLAQNNNHTARFEAYGTATAIDTSASNGIFYRINGSDIVKFAADGNVGIGSTSPAYKLDVNGSIAFSGYRFADFNTYYNRIFEPAGNVAMYLGNASDPGNYYDNTTHTFRNRGGSSVYAYINSSGNLGIGTTSPKNKLSVISSDSTLYYNSTAPVAVFQAVSPSTVLIAVDGNVNGYYSELKLGNAQATYYTYSAYIRGIQGGGIDYYRLEFGTANGSAASTRMTIATDGNVGIGTTSPSATLTVIATNNTGSRIQLGTASNSTYMDANKVNDFMVMTAPFGASPASVSNGGAKWGIKLNGSIDTINTKAKSAAIYAVSEENSAGYNRMVGLALHTSGFDLENSEKVRIKNDGNVGIGTTNPGFKLEVNGTMQVAGNTTMAGNLTIARAGAYLYINGTNSDAEIIWLAGNANRWAAGMNVGDATENFNIYNYTTATTNFTILKANGNVGIGSATPAYKLDVNGGVNINGILSVAGVAVLNTATNANDIYANIRVIRNASSTLTDGMYIGYDGTGTTAAHLRFYANGTSERMRIQANDGFVGIGTSAAVGRLDVYDSTDAGHVAFVRNASTGTSAYSAIVLRRNGDANGIVLFTNSSNRSTDGGAGNSTIRTDNGNLLLGAGGTTYHILNTAGSVGIGTTTVESGCLVTFKASNTARLSITDGSTRAHLWPTGGNFYLSTETASDMIIITNATERMRITSAGNIGIGTSSPSTKFSIIGTMSSVSINAQRQYTYSAIGSTNDDIWFRSSTSFANNGAAASLNLARLTYQSAGTGNDLTDKVGIWLRGFYDNSGGGLPIYLGGYAYSSQIPAVTITGLNSDGGGGNLGIGTTAPLSKLNSYGSGSNLSVFRVDGGNGTLFEVTDQLSGSLFSVNDVSGLPLLEVFSNNRVVAGKYGSNALVISGSSVGIGTTTPAYKLQVNGSFAATTKSFVIKHPDPAKSDKQLVHGVTEGPEHSVFVRGNLLNNNIIQLPDYWQHLVDADTITVTLTPNKYYQQLYVKNVTDKSIEVGSETDKPINCYYYIVGERKDIPKLITEI